MAATLALLALGPQALAQDRTQWTRPEAPPDRAWLTEALTELHPCLEADAPSWCGLEETYAAAKWAWSLELEVLALHGLERSYSMLEQLEPWPEEDVWRGLIEGKLFGLAQLVGDYSIAEFLVDTDKEPTGLIKPAFAWARCVGPEEEVSGSHVVPIGWGGLVELEQGALDALIDEGSFDEATARALRLRHRELAAEAPGTIARHDFDDQCGPDGRPAESSAVVGVDDRIGPWPGHLRRQMVDASKRSRTKREQILARYHQCLMAPRECRLQETFAAAVDAFWLGLPSAALPALDAMSRSHLGEPYLLYLAQRTQDDRLLGFFFEDPSLWTALPEGYAWARCEGAREDIPALYRGSPSSWREVRREERAVLHDLAEDGLDPAVVRSLTRAVRRGRRTLRKMQRPSPSCGAGGP